MTGTQTIVVGIDGSDVAKAALAFAADETERREAELVVVHARRIGHDLDGNDAAESHARAVLGEARPLRYLPFLERALSLARRNGRVGLVLPWGLATDDGYSPDSRTNRTREG